MIVSSELTLRRLRGCQWFCLWGQPVSKTCGGLKYICLLNMFLIGNDWLQTVLQFPGVSHHKYQKDKTHHKYQCKKRQEPISKQSGLMYSAWFAGAIS